VPDSFKIHPGVDVQCLSPDFRWSEQKGAPGTCTMAHFLQFDWAHCLASLACCPRERAVITPTINHSHIIDD